MHHPAGAQSNPVLSALAKTGLFSLAEHLEHNTVYTVTSVSCFVAALLLPYCAAQGLLQAATAALLGKAALGVTYLLSGVPQLAETVGAAVAGKVDTHVLMSLSVIGTLYMGMAQEVGALQQQVFRACAMWLAACCSVSCGKHCCGMRGSSPICHASAAADVLLCPRVRCCCCYSV
jgi:cation transport ATPase